MAQQSPIGNPFILMMNPEVVLAAIASSERLEKLDRRMCRPLDKSQPGAAADDAAGEDPADDGRAPRS